MRNFTLIGFTLRGKLSPKATDEGRRCLYNPSKGYCKNFAPHPAFGHLPPQGKAFCSQFVTISLQCLDAASILCYNTESINHDGTLLHRFRYKLKTEIKEAFSR